MKPFIPQKLPLDSIRWEPLIPLLGQAYRSATYYDGVLKGLPNPELLLSPLTTQEAVLSSKIEGTQVGSSLPDRHVVGPRAVVAGRESARGHWKSLLRKWIAHGNECAVF